ncbi:molybdenum cofactor guanylyltransferase MobA [Vogesella indigofera]|uniref:molybdenum cofactor guanylyltransferase MobA n=1 Tax=Vogesella indigofera TaxID=45465 RepID=UPI00234F3E9D|nr:molybdenum cofactor guanylyltransferase MobA [Vogesella indigofera]MDC7700237.1 molybdenum cofactor guanylyltransferase [Vogesella indigofera]
MTEQVAVLLLAGGEGRRMGGQDKGLLPWCGQPLYRHVLARLAPQAGWLAISANRHLADYTASGHAVFADEAAWQGMGPLAGVATLADKLPDGIDYVQLVPCDAPLLPADLVARQLAILQAERRADACCPYTINGPQPVCALLRRSALARLPDYLASGGRSLRGFLALLDCRIVNFDDTRAFSNLNDPQSLAQLGQ